MKAATGELNLTVFVVIAVAIMSAFFYTVIWPMIRTNQNAIVRCKDAICGTDVEDGMVTCYLNGRENETFLCTWKG